VTSESPREERECPHCAELILAKAKLCKHCGSVVTPLSAASNVEPAETPRRPQIDRTQSQPHASGGLRAKSDPIFTIVIFLVVLILWADLYSPAHGLESLRGLFALDSTKPRRLNVPDPSHAQPQQDSATAVAPINTEIPNPRQQSESVSTISVPNSSEERTIEGFLRNCDYEGIPSSWKDTILNIPFGDKVLSKVTLAAQDDFRLNVGFVFEGYFNASDGERWNALWGGTASGKAESPDFQPRRFSRSGSGGESHGPQVVEMKIESNRNSFVVSCAITRSGK
jgi:hypothetical protein